MFHSSRPLSLRSLLIAALLFIPAALSAQTATLALYYDVSNSGSDGTNPYGGVIQASDGNIYGVNQYGASAGDGTLFRITSQSPYTFQVLHTFTGSTTDGAVPNALIELPDGNLYGTTSYGGVNNRGTIFKFNPATSKFTLLYSFANKTSDGDNPYGHIIFDGTYIYGTTYANDSDATSFGTLWKYKPDLGSGSSGPTVLLLFDNATNADFGEQPWDGVTDVDGVLYGTSFQGSGFTCGALFSSAITGTDNQVLHIFTNGLDGCGPLASVKYWSDGYLYGTTNQYQDANTLFGSVYHSGTSPNTLTFNTSFSSAAYPDGDVAFDGSGNLLFVNANGGTNNTGEFEFMTPAPAEPNSPNPVTTLYSFPASGTPGIAPTTVPFIDNQGRVWIDLYYGGASKGYGGIAAFNVSTVTAPPIKLTATPASVVAGASSKIAWSVNNAFSTDEQYCFASGNSNAKWQGVQTGTYSDGIYSGSSTVSFTTPGTYNFAITCGGTESALATLTVTSATVATTTTLTASPNPIQSGANITLTATVKKSSGSGTPTGKVAFKYGSDTLATVSLNSSGVATLTAPTTGYPIATYGIVAAYAGDSGDDASTSSTVDVQVVKDTTTTALTISPTSVVIGADVTLTATVKSTVGSKPTGSVAFKDGSTTLGTVTLSGGVATAKVSSKGYPAGTYNITAVYSGDATQATSTSPAVKVTLTN
jgi:uncharacterized repeat protein (TIGR03803 family)